MAMVILKCKDGVSINHPDRDAICESFQLVADYLADFPDHEAVEIDVDHRDLLPLYLSNDLKKIDTLEKWQRVLNVAEYLQCSDKIREEIHDVFSDYMHYHHQTDMILAYDAYNYDDYRMKIQDPKYKTEAELGVLNTFKQLWG